MYGLKFVENNFMEEYTFTYVFSGKFQQYDKLQIALYIYTICICFVE